MIKKLINLTVISFGLFVALTFSHSQAHAAESLKFKILNEVALLPQQALERRTGDRKDSRFTSNVEDSYIQKYLEQGSIKLFILALEKTIFSLYLEKTQSKHVKTIDGQNINEAIHVLGETFIKTMVLPDLNKSVGDTADCRIVEFFLTGEHGLLPLLVAKEGEAASRLTAINLRKLEMDKVHEAIYILLLTTLKSRIVANASYYSSLSEFQKESLAKSFLSRIESEEDIIVTAKILKAMNVNPKFLETYFSHFTEFQQKIARGPKAASMALRLVKIARSGKTIQCENIIGEISSSSKIEIKN